MLVKECYIDELSFACIVRIDIVYYTSHATVVKHY